MTATDDAEFDAPRDDLVRMVRGEIRSEGDGRTLVGYAAMFNKPTTINSWEGNFREVIAPGAFARSLKNNGSQIKVLFNHGMDPSIGDKPLGRASVMREDARGLYVEVPLSDTSYNNDIRALLADGALDGMSFRFSVPTNGDVWEYPTKGLPNRTLIELKLHELGPVTFPAYQATSAGVRSRKEFAFLRDLPEHMRAELLDILSATSAVPSLAVRTDDEEPGLADLQDPGHTHSSVNHHARLQRMRERLQEIK